MQPSSPSTGCLFFIKASENTNDINTHIAMLGTEKVATIGLTAHFSVELASVFSKEDDGMFNYLFQTNRTTLKIKGASFGNTVIGFSEF